MIHLLSSAGTAGLPHFSADDVLSGTAARAELRDAPGRVWIEVDGVPESLCLYGAEGPSSMPPLVYLDGDCSRRVEGAWSVYGGYSAHSPHTLQRWAEQIASSTARTFVNLARPGIHGSTGDHQKRRRLREVSVVDAALSALKEAFGWDRIDLAGFSGGGHLVAAVLSRRSDVGCAVIASGNVSVRQRNREKGWSADITGYSDFIDPIDLVEKVATHPPQHVVVLTDPRDQVVSAACQTAYVEALRRAGVAVDHRFVPSTEPTRHVLIGAALLAAAASPSKPIRDGGPVPPRDSGGA